MGIVSQQEQKQDAKETSSSITTAQQGGSREAAGMEQKQAGTQKECKDVITEWGKRKPQELDQEYLRIEQ